MPSSAITTTSMAVAHGHCTKTQFVAARVEDDEEEKFLTQEFKDFLLSLPRQKGWRTPYLYEFQGFWCQPKEIQSILSFQNHFKSRESDVILATIPKSGTTWLKGLVFSIINRKRFDVLDSKTHPLLYSNPHDLVPFFEYKLYSNSEIPDLSKLPDPRLFATHIPFNSLMLQESIKSTTPKIVYLCRNPLDTFISSWHYLTNLRPKSVAPFQIEEAFKMYCEGIIGFGPFWEHMLGYWNESLKNPNGVLFLKYEEMREDIVSNLKKLASFLGCPFSVEEEKEGVIKEIAKLCSFDKMKNLEVNKSGKSIKNFENKHLFRKGEVGDWVNFLSPSMVAQISQVMAEKLAESGLTFKLSA